MGVTTQVRIGGKRKTGCANTKNGDVSIKKLPERVRSGHEDGSKGSVSVKRKGRVLNDGHGGANALGAIVRRTR